MSHVVSVQRFKQGILVLLVAVLAFAGGMSIQGAQAQRGDNPNQGDPYELLIMSLQIDFVCSSNYTGVDRIGKSISVYRLFQDFQVGAVDGPSYFESPCRSYETGRITFSLNPTMLMQLFDSGEGVAGR